MQGIHITKLGRFLNHHILQGLQTDGHAFLEFTSLKIRHDLLTLNNQTLKPKFEVRHAVGCINRST